VLEFDTFDPSLQSGSHRWPSRGEVVARARSMALLRRS
jgi:hypothetical protein